MVRFTARGHRPALPAEVSHALALERGERPLAWAVGPDGQWYVGTDRALYLSAEYLSTDYLSAQGGRRLRWEQIERAEWQQEADLLGIVEVVGWGRPEVRTELPLVEPGQLLELLRERVTKSVLVTAYAVVHGRRGLSVVGRRSPLGVGDVLWSYVLAQGLDPEDPLVVEVAERTLLKARAELAWL